MKTIFVINPEAGQGKNIDALIDSINNTISKLKADAQIYITKSIGDAEEYVKNFCEKFGAARFIACGGDGTLSEVLNGAIETKGTEIGVIPIGTGNDFCRNFDKASGFSDIEGQLKGEAVECDAIKFSTKEKIGYCVNMFNIGFDCNVADLTQEMKKKPFVSGSLAYFLSILITLIKKKGSDLKIEIDGKPAHNGKLLLTSLANGCYCGGGIKSNPLASIKDGFINVNIIKNLTRSKFISLLPHYMKGTIHNVRGVEKYISTKSCQNITVTPNKGKMRICIDGEIIDAEKTQFEIVHNAFKFVLPYSEVADASKVPELV
ncbi:MAG: YegS/Rv2252/BmrU family lipid kinase [Clostridia bacterium]|nr:YegS/Rv2252/BmrU family lipid kinase [Clostridia bacterium]